MKLTTTPLSLLVCLALWTVAPAQESLPQALKYDMKRMEETWNILDQIAEKVWPGWTGYQDVPFHITYPNGLELLIDHPSPPDGFELVEGVTVAGKTVHLNRSHEDQTPLIQPLTYGGGILPYGKSQNIMTVDLHATSPSGSKPVAIAGEPDPQASDKNIIMNIHELFHVYQRTVYRYRYGNLQYNPVADFALYAEVEGMALEKAYWATDAAEARQAMADFLVARALKRQAMDETEGHQESEDELMEGTATYTEIRTCELLKGGFSSKIGQDDDPYYRHFQEADKVIALKLRYLGENREETLEARGKCYFSGAFQALMLSRLAPGWQTGFFKSGEFMDAALSEKLTLTDAEQEAAQAGLENRYDVAALREKHGEHIAQRDAALETLESRQGQSYIISFKPVHEYIYPHFRGETYRLGLMVMAPQGVDSLTLFDIHITGEKTPMFQDQLYYLKWVDNETPADEKGYTLDYDRKEGEDVYINATVRCGGFTLKAPKLRVTERPNRVKFTLLAKVAG